jgi:hypothetical protein
MLTNVVDWIWCVVLAATAVFYVATYVAPRAVMSLQSMPWAFHLARNIDLDLQSVLYATYHTRWLSRLSHLSIPLEQVAWFVIFASMHPAAFVAALLLLAAQALLCRESPLAFVVMAAWGVVSGAALLAIHLLGVEVAHLGAVVVLLAAALWRMASHAVEPIPPNILERSDRFLSVDKIELTPKLMVMFVIGFISEFASGLPFRLFIVQVSWLAQALGYRPRRTMRWAEARRIAAQIHERGWRAYSPLRRMMPDLFPAAPGGRTG